MLHLKRTPLDDQSKERSVKLRVREEDMYCTGPGSLVTACRYATLIIFTSVPISIRRRGRLDLPPHGYLHDFDTWMFSRSCIFTSVPISIRLRGVYICVSSNVTFSVLPKNQSADSFCNLMCNLGRGQRRVQVPPPTFISLSTFKYIMRPERIILQKKVGTRPNIHHML
jgi:hypothetical protein